MTGAFGGALNFSEDQAVRAGQQQIAVSGERVECALLLMEEIPARLPAVVVR